MSRAQSLFGAITRKTSGGPTYTIPKLIGGAGASGRPCRLKVVRPLDGASALLEGTVAVFGTNLPHINGPNAASQRFVGADGATGRTIFTTILAYAAWANYNFIILVNGVVIENGSGAGKCQISDVGGFAVITFGTALAVADVMQVAYAVPTEVLADGAHVYEDTEIVGKDLLWLVGTHDGGSSDLSAVQAWVQPID